jgi:hypothetical protein
VIVELERKNDFYSKSSKFLNLAPSAISKGAKDTYHKSLLFCPNKYNSSGIPKTFLGK